VQGLTPSCIDWAALPAIAGDHSCSSQEMLDTVLTKDWILAVADVAAQLKVDLARVPVVPPPGTPLPKEENLPEIRDLRRRVQSSELRAERMNALRTSDTRLQRADPGYATRAGANNAHFLLPRPTLNISTVDYGKMTAEAGAELNAIGVYASIHLSALQKATRLASEQLTPQERRRLTRAMLADEAFALHFLEDVFASGHVAGTWGDASQRKGTHDFYNENGLEVVNWMGSNGSIVLMGDAHMRPEDAQLAAKSVRTSLEQVLDVASGKVALRHTPLAPAAPDALDVCKSTTLPRREEGLRAAADTVPLNETVLIPTPMPGLGAGLGSLPRFRSELGPFIGLAGTIDARAVNGGFAPTQTSHGAIAGLDLSFIAGFGLEGVIGESGDGLVFASIGLRADSASSNKISDSLSSSEGGSITAAIPARTGLSTRLRMPYYLVPGDLLLLSPMVFFDRDAYTAMAVTASNGGLIPWQLGWATSIGRFQFVLGRELGITFYGVTSNDQLIAPPSTPGGGLSFVQFKSISYDLPIAEYRPYRSFAGNQSSTVLFQLFANADVPRAGSTVFPPGSPAVDLKTVWSLGLRMVFDWRLYR